MIQSSCRRVGASSPHLATANRKESRNANKERRAFVYNIPRFRVTQRMWIFHSHHRTSMTLRTSSLGL
uniref:Integron gene cassette protein n=1 Tax=Mesocestoides corti TaxID=53468 RepID=A0A5K3FQ79_MESCO